MVFLPDLLLQRLDDDGLDAVLGHELAHVKRWDDLCVCLQQMLKLLFFFNPLLWFSGRRISELRELSCDALVLRRSPLQPAQYGRCLLRVVELNQGDRPGPSVVAGLTSSALRRRIESLWQPRSLRPALLPVASTVIVLTALTLLMAPEPQEPFSFEESRTLLAGIGAVSPLPGAKQQRGFSPGTGCLVPANRAALHPGVDFVAPDGGVAVVRAVADGRVEVAYSPMVLGGGKAMKLSHRGHITSSYLYLDEVLVEPGERVRAGQPIARIDGSSRHPHLHLEMHRAGQLIDTTPLLAL